MLIAITCIWKIIEIKRIVMGRILNLEFAFSFVFSVVPINVVFDCLKRIWVPHLSSKACQVELPPCIQVVRVKLRMGLVEGGIFALSSKSLSTGNLFNQLVTKVVGPWIPPFHHVSCTPKKEKCAMDLHSTLVHVVYHLFLLFSSFVCV